MKRAASIAMFLLLGLTADGLAMQASPPRSRTPGSIANKANTSARPTANVRSNAQPYAVPASTTFTRPTVASPRVQTQTATRTALQRSLLARVTVYWASGGAGSDRWTRKHQAATSVRLRAGHCAVDPRHIPYGSKVCFPDATLLAVDTGKHVVSRKAARLSGRGALEKNALVIDRFFETKRQAEKWANSHPPFMTVQVIPPGARMPAPAASSLVRPANSRLVADNAARSPGLARAASLPSLP